MKRIVLTGWSLVLALCGLVGSAERSQAVPFDNNPKILLHLKSTTTKAACGGWGNLLDCQQAITSGVTSISPAFQGYFAYLLAATGPHRSTALGGDNLGVGFIRCGIQYNGAQGSGVDVFSWTRCASLDFPSSGWPDTGGTNLITWDTISNCQRAEVGIAGYFYLAAYSPDVLEITPGASSAAISTCDYIEESLSTWDLGRVAFSGDGMTPGANPCQEYTIYGSPVGISYSTATGCPPSTVGTTPVDITISQGIPPYEVHGYSIEVQIQPGYTLSGAGIQQGSYLSSVGSTSFFVTNLPNNTYQVDCVLLGTPCSSSALSGTLFVVNMTRSASSGSGAVLTLPGYTVRKCNNLGIPVQLIASSVDVTGPPPVSDLGSTQVKTGNGTGGRTGIQLFFTIPPEAASVQVYRAPFGAYPQYDEAGGSVPAIPAYPPGSPWTLTGVTATGQTDTPPTRDFWYYVAFSKDACGNASAVSNRSAGTLNYHLGDVSNGTTVCAGDNRVLTADLSYLGSNYGRTVASNSTFACLDVGPTSLGTTNGRPLTDRVINFEDLSLFSINYGAVSAPRWREEISTSEGASTTVFLAPVITNGSGNLELPVGVDSDQSVQAMSVQIEYDARVVQPLGVSRGSLLNDLPFETILLSPRPGTVDFAGLGHGNSLKGNGELSRMQFRILGPGDPAIQIAGADGRDPENRKLEVRVRDSRVAPPLPVGAQLGPPFPNPARAAVQFEVRLPAPSPVNITILDYQGRLVRRLEQGHRAAGTEVRIWDGRDDMGRSVVNGTYFVLMVSDTNQDVRKVQVTR